MHEGPTIDCGVSNPISLIDWFTLVHAHVLLLMQQFTIKTSHWRHTWCFFLWRSLMKRQDANMRQWHQKSMIKSLFFDNFLNITGSSKARRSSLVWNTYSFSAYAVRKPLVLHETRRDEGACHSHDSGICNIKPHMLLVSDHKTRTERLNFSTLKSVFFNAWLKKCLCDYK